MEFLPSSDVLSRLDGELCRLQPQVRVETAWSQGSLDWTAMHEAASIAWALLFPPSAALWLILLLTLNRLPSQLF
jgi:hypothetical protein